MNSLSKEFRVLTVGLQELKLEMILFPEFCQRFCKTGQENCLVSFRATASETCITRMKQDYFSRPVLINLYCFVGTTPKTSKDKVTLLLTLSWVGEKIKPILIWKSKSLRALKSASKDRIPEFYHHQAKA